MPALTSLPLSSLRVHKRLADCPVGALIQIATTGRPAVCLRTEMLAPGDSLKGVVQLEGAEAGFFFADPDIGHIPAIDLADVAEIRVTELNPMFSENMPDVGDLGAVFYTIDQNGMSSIGIAVATRANRTVRRFAHLSGEKIGQLDNFVNRVYVGKIEVHPIRFELPYMIASRPK